MKITRNALRLSYKLLAIVAALLLLFAQADLDFGGIDALLLVGLLANAAYTYFQYRKRKSEDEKGFPTNDEMSNKIKHKAGYVAFMISLPLWLIIYIVGKLNQIDDWVVGASVLMSGLIYIVAKIIIKHRPYAK